MARMLFGQFIFLLINLAYVQLFVRPDLGCDFAERLGSQQMSFFKNPHWPATYAPGTICRWTFDCPLWYACRLQCLDVGLPQTDDCYMDKLIVSGSVTPQLNNAQVFCGRTEINYRSVASKITLALITSKLSPGGRFRCTIRSEPWSQPWFMPSGTPDPKIVNRNKISNKKEDAVHHQKIITSSNTNHRRIHSDVPPHTGLIQSKPQCIEKEPAKTAHIKNIIPEPMYGNRIEKNASYFKHAREKTYSEEVGSSITMRPQGLPVYPINLIDDGSPRLVSREFRTQQFQEKLQAADVDSSATGIAYNDNASMDSSNVNDIILQPQDSTKNTKKQKKTRAMSHENFEDDGASSNENEQDMGPSMIHARAEPAERHVTNPHITLVPPYPENLEDSVPSSDELDSRVVHIRRPKSVSPQYENLPEKEKKLHPRDILVKKSYFRSKNTGEPDIESYQVRRKFHHEIDVTPNSKKFKTPVTRIKASLPYDDNINPDVKIDIPFLENIDDGVEMIRTDYITARKVNADTPHDRQTVRDTPRRKHTLVSQIKRSHDSNILPVKHMVKPKQRRPLKRSRSKSRHERVKRRRASSSKTSRVRTRGNRSSKLAPIPLYTGKTGIKDENNHILKRSVF